MVYKIYQLNYHNQNVIRDHKMYEGWEMLNKTAGFSMWDYEKVYEGETNLDEKFDNITILENLFAKFNLDHPEDFHGHSLSVSDVVDLDGTLYYCDDYGWVNTKTGKNV